MTNSRGWRLFGAGVCLTGLLAAGCGDSDGGGSDENPDSPGPLAEFFGWDQQAALGEQEFTEEDRQRHYELQEYVADCMAEAGFEYFPETFWGDREDLPAGDDPWSEVWELQQEDPEAFAREYGYGLTTIDTGREMPEEEVHDDDPNLEYQEGLSEAARQEYQKALWGDWEEIEAEIEEDGGTERAIDPGEIGGCHNEAQEEVYGRGPGSDQDQFEDLQNEMNSLHERVQNDPRLTEAKQAWSSCMAEAGYPDLEERWDPQERVHERQNEVYGWDDGGPASPVPADRDEAEEGEPEDIEPVEPDEAELEALREFELEIAWADYECQQEHDLEQTEREVRFELEEQFIEDHRAELEEYRDWLNEQGALG